MREQRKAEWIVRLEQKHGLPFEQIPGMVYILHYDEPQIVKSVSTDYSGPPMWASRDSSGPLSSKPIRHYVGWTQQTDPLRRINKHGPVAKRTVAYLESGTPGDEESMKQNGVCLQCGEKLSVSLD